MIVMIIIIFGIIQNIIEEGKVSRKTKEIYKKYMIKKERNRIL